MPIKRRRNIRNSKGTVELRVRGTYEVLEEILEERYAVYYKKNPVVAHIERKLIDVKRRKELAAIDCKRHKWVKTIKRKVRVR